MFARDGAATPGPSPECDITFFVEGRPKSARQSRDSTVAARRVQSVTVPSSRVSRECRSPGLRSPPFKNARLEGIRKMFPKTDFWKITNFLRGRPCLELIIASSNFQALLFLQDKSVWKLLIPQKGWEITGPALSTINSVIILARTVLQEPLSSKPWILQTVN